MEHLLPHSLFTSAAMPLLIGMAAAGLYSLAKGADWLVEGSTDLALRAGLPKVIIGATLLSLGTTAPECAVSVMAAVQGEPGLALGNAVGSVIFDTAVIFGGLSLLTRLPADRYILSRQGWWQFGSAVLLAVASYAFYMTADVGPAIPRWFGVLLLTLLAVYMAMSVRWAKTHPEAGVQEMAEENAAKIHGGVGASLFWMALGLAVVIFAGHVVVESVSEVARRQGISEAVIAATFVAFGTSLPELVVGFKAIRRGAGEILVGNVIGADVLNVLFVAGAAATASPLPLLSEHPPRDVFLTTHLPVMLGCLLYFRFCIFRATRTGYFERWMGIPLLIAYAGYAVWPFLGE